MLSASSAAYVSAAAVAADAATNATALLLVGPARCFFSSFQLSSESCMMDVVNSQKSFRVRILIT